MNSASSTPHDASTQESEQDEITETTLEALELVLMELSENEQRGDAIPQWEFCEGFMTAMLCMRRPVDDGEWLPLLLGQTAGGPPIALFDSPGQQTRFMMHWLARQTQLRHMLDAYLDDFNQDMPLLVPAMVDWLGLTLAVQSGKIDLDGDGDGATSPDASGPEDVSELPAYGQAWAAGFMQAVALWADDWKAPRDPELAASWHDALDCVNTLTRPDTGRPSLNLVHEEAPPSLSEQRFNDVGEALFAVHDLYAMAKSLGPRTPPVLRGPKTGRNDPCPCGSGKKYKHCCAA